MADRISTLPDELLCHILSFLPTKLAVATSVLSKRLKPLWRSVPALDFDDYFYDDDNKETSFRFVQSVYTAFLSRDLRQPIQRLSLRCGFSEILDLINVDVWVNTAVQCGLEHLDLCPNWTWSTFHLSPVITCRTLVILKLDQLFVGAFSSVDLPCLKILHFGTVRFIKPVYLANFLSGCPVLEILKVNNVFFENDMAVAEAEAEAEFKCLPKLLRAHIDGLDNSMLKAVKNVEFLDIDRVDAMYYYLEVDNKDFISDTMFSNLMHIELNYIRYDNRDWPLLLEALNNCPKLQVLVIDKPAHFPDDEEIGGDWPYPQSVPTCILWRLKKCHLKAYDGMKGQFRFARYIMQNARFLRRMIICSYICVPRREKLKMIKKLSLCTRRSATCKVSFK